MRISRFAANFERLQFLSNLRQALFRSTRKNPVTLIYKKIGRLSSPEFQDEVSYTGFVEPRYLQSLTPLSAAIPFTDLSGKVRRLSIDKLVEFSTEVLPEAVAPAAQEEPPEDKLVTLKIPASFLAILSAQVPEISNYLVQDE